MRLLGARSICSSLVACLLFSDAAEDSAGICRGPEGAASLLQISAGKVPKERHKINEPLNKIQTQEGLQKRVPDMTRGLHRVVGKDGVLMISLPRNKNRWDSAQAKFSEVGILPTMFPGTDGVDLNTSQEILDKAINGVYYFPGSPGVRSSRWAAGLADSHRRALEHAQRRQENWTAILEDDAVPAFADGMNGTMWLNAFESAWATLPPRVKLVRMGYCWEDGVDRLRLGGASGFMITTWTEWGLNGKVSYEPGICTTGYIVHKDAIPELLSTFPCGTTLDVCWNMYFKLFSDRRGIYTTNGGHILANLELNDAEPAAQYGWNNPTGIRKPGVRQYGIIKQDREAHGSTFTYGLVEALMEAERRSQGDQVTHMTDRMKAQASRA